jgi:DNA-binding response OmpR family regulator
MASVLLVEDDETIGRALQSSLELHGYDVQWESAGRGALAAAEARDFDLVLLDVGLPDLDGVEVCRRLRRLSPDSVLVMLTARQDEMDVVLGLDAGADDYLTKPVRLAELQARLRAHLRRGSADGGAAISVGALTVDLAARQATLAGREIVLRAKEFDLLERLVRDAGTAVTRETLMTDVWDEHWFGSTKTLDVHVAALRRKLTTDGPTPADGPAGPVITTLRGYGYRLELPDR